MMEYDSEGNSHPVTKDYDAIRCDKCKGVMKVLKVDFQHECEHCGCEYSFALEEENGNAS